MTDMLTEKELALIQTQPVCRVATPNADGTTHLVALCPVVVDGKVYLDFQGAKHTERNVAREGKATVLFDEYSSDWTKLWGVQLRCRAVFVEENSDEWRTVWAAMERLYPQHAVLAWKPRCLTRLTPERKISWGLG